jgi:hypothetical protein
MNPTPIRARPSRNTCQPHAYRRGLGASPSRPTVDLNPRTVEQIAQRVAQLLRRDQLTTLANPAPRDTSLLTVKELARHFKLNPAWVYEHAQELGAIRTGNGPKARMHNPAPARASAARTLCSRRAVARDPAPRGPPSASTSRVRVSHRSSLV